MEPAVAMTPLRAEVAVRVAGGGVVVEALTTHLMLAAGPLMPFATA
jgi:hypothetical protein